MSDTLNDVDTAIQRHIGTVTGGSVTDAWIVIVHNQSLDPADGPLGAYQILTSDTQPLHVDVGLLEMGRKIIQASWDDALYGDDDDDD